MEAIIHSLHIEIKEDQLFLLTIWMSDIGSQCIFLSINDLFHFFVISQQLQVHNAGLVPGNQSRGLRKSRGKYYIHTMYKYIIMFRFRYSGSERLLLFEFLKRRSITYKISRVVKFVLPVPGNCDDLQPL